MATISSPGLGSGLDVNSIVTQLVALERQPIQKLQTQAASIQSKLSSFGLLQSYASNLRDIATKLAKPDFWTQTSASSSDIGTIGVSSTVTAASGTYSVVVTQLAQSQSLASSAFASSATTVGTGVLRIELGSWDDGLTTFTADAAKTPIDIDILAGEGSLDSIKNKINAANAGVTAAIVTDSNGARLTLRSIATGATSAVRVTATTDDDGITTDNAGLSALSFNPPTAGFMTQTAVAKNLQGTINGLAVTSATNTLTNVIDGVTLTVNKATTSAVDVKVGLDTVAQRKAITDFAKAYSDMNAYIAAQTKYDATTKKAAALQGDRATLTLQSNLRSVFTDSSMASLFFTRLSDVGLQFQKDGSLTVNDAKMTAALAQPTEVARMFSNVDLGSGSAQGFAVRVKELTEKMVGVEGVISARTAGLRDSVKRNSAEQQRLEDRVALKEQRLLKQYAALDTQLNRIKGGGSSLTQALEALSNLNKSMSSSG
jgi:flagellar hook-associated protein 2